jgi:predicted TIM-barrel fold metal-dependent hydrolase
MKSNDWSKPQPRHGFHKIRQWERLRCASERIANEEVYDPAIIIAFASIDPYQGRMGVRDARRQIKDGVVKGRKFRLTVQGFFPNVRHRRSKSRPGVR